jgi:hypothetical protein
MVDKAPMFVWSGGLDSTAAILLYIEDKLYSSTPATELVINTLYIHVNNNWQKSCCERQARFNMRCLIENQYGRTIKFNDRIITIGALGGDLGELSLQPWMWAMVAAQQTSRANPPYSEIRYGYILEDQFWHRRHNFEALFYSAYQLTCANPNYELPKLVYPLEWFGKKDVVDIYNKRPFYRQLLEHTWTCEEPIIKEEEKDRLTKLAETSWIPESEAKHFTTCGKCLPCLAHKKWTRYLRLKARKSQLAAEVPNTDTEISSAEETEDLKKE